MVARKTIKVDGHKASLILPARSAQEMREKVRWELYKARVGIEKREGGRAA